MTLDGVGLTPEQCEERARKIVEQLEGVHGEELVVFLQGIVLMVLCEEAHRDIREPSTQDEMYRALVRATVLGLEAAEAVDVFLPSTIPAKARAQAVEDARRLSDRGKGDPN